MGEFSVKVNHVPQGTRTDDLRGVFESMGYSTITDVYLPEKFLRQGFGFVRFSDQDEAQRATSDNLFMGNTPLVCEAALTEKRKGADKQSDAPMRGASAWPPAPQATTTGGEHSVWIGNLPNGVSSDQLRQAVEGCGIDSMTDVYVPDHKGFGFARFSTYEEATRALEACEGLEIDGRPVELKLSAGKARNKGGAPAPETSSWGYGNDYSYPPAPQAFSWGNNGNGAAPQAFSWGNNNGAAQTWGYGNDWGPSWGASNGHSQMGAGAHDRQPAQPVASGKVTEHSVHVSGLPPHATAEELQEAFNARGVESMTDVYVPPGKGFGFVRFATYEEASKAQWACASIRIRGSSVELKLSSKEKWKAGGGDGRGGGGPPPAAMSRSEPSGGFAYEMPAQYEGYGSRPSGGGKASQISVKVGNLRQGTSSDDLREAFASQGLESMMTDAYIPNGKAFGFLRFSKLSAAQAALQCEGMSIRGSSITCELAEGDKRSSNEMSYGGGSAPMRHELVQTGDSEVSIKVGNLPPGASSGDVLDAFAAQGIDTMTDCYIPQGRPFGFVRFNTSAEGRLALQRNVQMRGAPLTLEPATNQKRSSGEMATGGMPPAKMPRMMQHPADSYAAPKGGFGEGAEPSVKVSSVPPGVTAKELQGALIYAGCAGNITDVYVPQGNRGFAFIRFSTIQEASDCAQLSLYLHGSQLGLEMAVQERRSARR